MGTSFVWTPKAETAFEEIKAGLTQAPVLSLRALVKFLK